MVNLYSYFFSSVRRFFSATALSRFTGFARDFTMAISFGDHEIVALFFIAFRLTHLFRRFLGEGPLQSAFIPLFANLKDKDENASHLFFRQLAFCVAMVSLVLILSTWAGAYCLLKVVSRDLSIIIYLTSLLIPSLLFIALYGLNLSFLQCYNRFFIAGFAPAFCNLAWILGILYYRNEPVEIAIYGVTKAIALGFFLQWLCTFIQVRSVIKDSKDVFKNIFNIHVKGLFKSFFVGALGVGGSQINAFTDTVFSRCASVNAPVYLWYSNRFYQLALACFGIVIVNTLVPSLSKEIKKASIRSAEKIFTFGHRVLMLVLTPLSIGMIIFGFSALNLAIGKGNFSLFALGETAKCLSCYAIGLIPAALILLYSAVFFANNDFKTPAAVSLATVLLNIILNTLFIFIFKFGAVSTALSTSICSWINFVVLNKRIKKFYLKLNYHLSDWAIVFIAAGIGVFCSSFIEPHLNSKLTKFLIPSMVYLGAYVFCILLNRAKLLDEAATEARGFMIKDN